MGMTLSSKYDDSATTDAPRKRSGVNGAGRRQESVRGGRSGMFTRPCGAVSELLRRALQNVLSNAIDCTPKGVVEVDALAEGAGFISKRP